MESKSEQYVKQLEFFINNHTEYELEQLRRFAASLEKQQ